jgi:hypothetical protein
VFFDGEQPISCSNGRFLSEFITNILSTGRRPGRPGDGIRDMAYKAHSMIPNMVRRLSGGLVRWISYCARQVILS